LKQRGSQLKPEAAWASDSSEATTGASPGPVRAVQDPARAVPAREPDPDEVQE
jgi:hypothetical protein